MPSIVVVLLAIIPALSSAACHQKFESGFVNRTVVAGDDVYHYQVFVPSHYSQEHQFPLILFLHGSGEAGTDGLSQTEDGLRGAIRRHPERYPAIVVFPQGQPIWTQHEADVTIRALEQTQGEFGTDPNRVYLTGFSRGGNASWYLAYRHPERFAALLVVSSWIQFGSATPAPIVPLEDGEPFRAVAQRLQRLPTWVFHGEADQVIPVDQSRQVVAALRELGVPVQYTELSGVGHSAWDNAYESFAVSQWLFKQRRTVP